MEAFSATNRPNLASPLFSPYLFLCRALSGVDLVLAAHAIIRLPVSPSSPRAPECATQEKAVAEEKKWLHRKKARKHEACQKCGVSLSNDGDDDDSDDAEDEDEGLMALNAPQRYSDATRSGDANRSTVTSSGGATKKHLAPSPPWGPSLMRSRTAMDGGWSPLSIASSVLPWWEAKLPSMGRMSRTLQ